MRAFALAFFVCLPAALQANDNVSRVNGSVRVAAGEIRGDVSTVNGSIEIEEGAQVADVETVNGSVRIGPKAVVRRIETVNGSVSFRAGARAEAVDTVNGGLTLDEGAQVGGPVTMVNGALRLARDAQISGDAENVNGDISLERARIEGKLRTSSGNVEIGAGSFLGGGLHVNKPGSNVSRLWRKPPPPRIVIGPGAVVEGVLKFEREVELYVSDSARIGAVQGAEPISYSGARPPR